MTAKFAPLALAVALTAILVAPIAAHEHAEDVPPRGCAPGDIVHWLTPPASASSTISPTTPLAPAFYSIEPRPGFDPTTASDADLSCYGMPPRPSATTARGLAVAADVLTSERARWNTEMTQAHYVVPVLGQTPPTMRGFNPAAGAGPSHPLPTAARVPHLPRRTSRNFTRIVESDTLWTGYVIESKDNNNNYYTLVEADFTVPTATFGPNGTDNGAVTVWAGLGGDTLANPQPYPTTNANDTRLIWQAGTATIVDPRVAFWFENFGCQYHPGAPCDNGNDGPGTEDFNILDAPSVQAGDKVRVDLDAANGTYYFYNQSTGFATNVHQVSIDNNNTGLSAEFIVEQGGCDYSCSYATYPTVTFSNAIAGSNGTGQFLDVLNYRRMDLCDDAEFITTVPSDVDPNTHGYSVSANSGQYISSPCINMRTI